MGRVYRVAIIVSSEFAFGRRIIRGVGDFARTNAQWELYLNPFDPLRVPARAHVRIDGIIAHPRTSECVADLRKWDGPLVRVGGEWPEGCRKVPMASADNGRAVALAVEDLVARGFRRFGFAGEEGTPASEMRARVLTAELRARDLPCAMHIGVSPFSLSRQWNQEVASLATWLGELETPLAVVASNDERAFLVVEACRRLRQGRARMIPEDVAVVGFDNSVELCETCNPSLSSVDLNTESVGYRAAQMLAQILDGGPIPPDETIPPRGMVHRQSTDTLAVEDPDLAAALRFIRQNLDQPLRISDVLGHVPLSRRGLEQRFRRRLGRSPAEEIQRLRLQRVATLLLDTDWTIKRIAHICGFPNGEQLARSFHHVLGLSPSDYRVRAMMGTVPPGSSSLTVAGSLAAALFPERTADTAK